MSFDLKITDGDLQISNTGDLQIVENTEKLIQDVLKIVTTPLGGNPFFPWYGGGISSSLIGSSLGLNFSNSIAKLQIEESLETLKKLQTLQTNTGQEVTPAETLAAVQTVDVMRNQVDPRYFRIVIKVLTKALTTASPSFDIRL